MKKIIFSILIFILLIFACKRAKKNQTTQALTVEAKTILKENFFIENFNKEISQYLEVYFESLALNESGYLNGIYTLYWGINTNLPSQAVSVNFQEGKGVLVINLKDIFERNDLTLNTQLFIDGQRYALPKADFTYLPLFDHPNTQYYQNNLTLTYNTNPLLIYQESVNFRLRILDLPKGKYRWYYQYSVQGQKKEKIEGSVFTHQLNIKDLVVALPPEEGDVNLQIVLHAIEQQENQYFFLSPFNLQIGEFSKDCVPIFTLEDFEKIAEDFKKNYCLFNDIDLKNVNFLPFSKPDQAFSGKLNGQGYALKNWNFSDKNKNNIGIFEELSEQALIENLFIEDFELEGQNNIGTIAGIGRGNIQGVYVKNVKIKGQDFLGGLTGKFEKGSLHFNQLENLQLSGKAWVGGLSGLANSNPGGGFYAQVVSATINASENAGLFFGELKAGSVKFSYALGELNSQKASSTLLFGNVVSNLRQVYGFGEKNQTKTLIYWNEQGVFTEKNSVYNMKTTIAQWQDYFAVPPEIQGEKPVPSSLNYYKIFKPSAVSHVKTAQQFPALFWVSGLSYAYQASQHDCTLKNVEFSFSTNKNATILSFPKPNLWPKLELLDTIHFLGINENFDWKTLTFKNAKVKNTSTNETYLHADLPICTEIWDAYPIVLHHLNLNLSFEQLGLVSQTLYTKEPLWENEFLALPKAAKNQTAKGLLSSSAYPIILHYKEGIGEKPLLETIQNQANIFWFDKQNALLPKQLEKIQWQNFIIPVVWDYKANVANLLEWQVAQQGQNFKATIIDDQKIQLELFPLTATNAVISLLENGLLYQQKKAKNNLEKLILNEEVFLSDQDEIWVVSEDETKVKKYLLQLTLKSSALGLKIEKATQNTELLKTKIKNQTFEIQKVNQRVLSTQGVNIEFALMENKGQKVSVNNQIVNVNNGKFNVDNIKNSQDTNPTKIKIEKDQESAEYIFDFTYKSNQAKLLIVKLQQNQQILNNDIQGAKIIVYGVNPNLDVNLIYYQHSNDGKNICGLENCVEKEPNKILNLLNEKLEIQAEDGTPYNYDFVFNYQYLVPKKTEIRLADLFLKDLFQIQFPPQVTTLEVKIQLDNQLFWTKNIDAKQTAYAFTDFFEAEKLYDLTKGVFSISILDINTKELLDSQTLTYDFTSIQKNEDFQALNIHKHAKVIFENHLNAAKSCWHIEDFLGEIDGKGYQIQQLNCLQTPKQDKKNYALFIYNQQIKGKIKIKNLVFNDFYLGLTDENTENAGLLFAKIPQNLEVQAENLQFFQGVLSVLFAEPTTSKTMPFGVFAGEILGKTTLNEIVFWDVILLGKTSYNALGIGKATGLEAKKIVVQGQINYNNDTKKPAQKYIGGLVAWAENSQFSEIYTIASFHFSGIYGYQTQRLGAFLGESKNNNFTQTYAVVNTYYNTLNNNETNFLAFPHQEPSELSLVWNGQLVISKGILPFGFDQNGTEIQQNRRKKIYTDADLCQSGLLSWGNSIFLQLESLGIAGTQTQICFPIWDTKIPLYNQRTDGSKTLFLISKDLLIVPVLK